MWHSFWANSADYLDLLVHSPVSRKTVFFLVYTVSYLFIYLFSHYKPLSSFYRSDSLTSETVCSSEGSTKGKHRKDEEPEGEEEDDEDRHNAKRLKFDKDAEEENEASGKELSRHAPVESSTDVAEPSLHISMEVKDTSVLISEDQGKLYWCPFICCCLGICIF